MSYHTAMHMVEAVIILHKIREGSKSIANWSDCKSRHSNHHVEHHTTGKKL